MKLTIDLPDEAGEIIVETACHMGLSVNDWITLVLADWLCALSTGELSTEE